MAVLLALFDKGCMLIHEGKDEGSGIRTPERDKALLVYLQYCNSQGTWLHLEESKSKLKVKLPRMVGEILPHGAMTFKP
jgi:hypothetical protein